MIEEKLSALGLQRRQEILSLAQGVARRRRQRRSVGRGLGVVCLFAVAALTAWSLTELKSTPLPQSLPVAQILKPESSPSNIVQYVATDPNITDRLSIKPQPPRWTTISNTELLAELSAAGQPVGIVCVNGKTMLLPK